uniref:Flavin-nucleotide-binding protein n=2 Tax=environmental samples TaxID=651140 RepID=A0A075FXX1_9ARCH|nr:flavin-nucleotide-binding protein [uncultured marine thaumarchaeote AD1000_46_C12]AIE94505.1 flavin-nucleotide-binding protein [uncultured marine thaumarchaeote AD1000_46_F05]
MKTLRKNISSKLTNEKYQPEGGYEPMDPKMEVLNEVAVIKVTPHTMRGKYKIGQNLRPTEKLELAKNIFKRNSKTARNTLKIMGFSVSDDGIKLEKDVEW